MSALDVAMRLRLLYQSKGAKSAQKDLQALSNAAKALGSGTGAGKLATDIQKIAPAADRAEKEVRDLERAIGKAGSKRLKTADELQKTAQAADRAEKEMRDLERAIGKVGARNIKSRVTDEMRRMAAEANRAEKEMRDLERAIGKVGMANVKGRMAGGVPVPVGKGKAGKGISAGVDAAAIMGVPGAGLASSAMMGGSALAGVGIAVAPIAAVAAVAAITTPIAMRFEDAMAEVKKAVDGSPEQIRALELEILRLSRTVPMASTEIAQLVAQAGFAGRPIEDLARFAVFGAKAAEAFGMGAEETGDSLAKLANVWGLNQAGIEDMADAINTLADSGAAKEADIIDFMLRMRDIPKSFGLAKHETAAFGATMLAMGTSSDVAATGLKFLLSRMQTAGKQGKEFQKGLKAIGLSGKQLEKNIQTNPLEAIYDVLARINKLDPQKRMDVLTSLGGQEYFGHLGQLAAAYAELEKQINNVSNAQKRVGSVERSFQIFDDLTSSKLDKMGNTFSELGTEIGNTFTPAVALWADTVTGLIGGATDGLRSLKEEVRSLTGWGQPDAPADHPVIAAATRDRAAQKNVAAAEASARRMEPDSEHFLRTAKAEADQAARALEAAMALPGSKEALEAAMNGLNQTLDAQGAQAVLTAQRIANQIRAALSFTAQPVIAPIFAPFGGGAGGGRASDGTPMPSPKPAAPQKKASLGGGGQQFAQTNTFHITGSNPEATARAIEQRLARLGSNANALTDTA